MPQVKVAVDACARLGRSERGRGLDDLVRGPNETPDNPLGDARSEARSQTTQRRRKGGKIALSQHTSLDGVMQSPGPTDLPFKYRGWIMDFDRGAEGDRFQLEHAQNSEALLLGRVTYEAMQAFWPQRKVSSPTG